MSINVEVLTRRSKQELISGKTGLFTQTSTEESTRRREELKREHRDSRLFAYRFSYSSRSVNEVVSRIKEPEEQTDAAGRDSLPIELSVLGSSRILTRNVTLDDLFVQTYISAELMIWYSVRLFPEVIRMHRLLLFFLPSSCCRYHLSFRN